MFERFTDSARRVLVLAQEEARLLRHNFIGTEHILLGLLGEGRELGVSADAIRSSIAETVGSPDLGVTTGSPPFTPRAKKVLELSLREALQLTHSFIGPEHLLLGLIREGEGVAVEALVGAGVDLGHLREKVVSYSRGDAPLPPVEARRPATGPRCPHCDRRLEKGGVAYKVLKVPRADRDGPADVADIAFVYCTGCGKVIAHAPFSDMENPDEG